MSSLSLLFPPDPGALRLFAALRATLAGLLTFFLVLALGTVVTVPVTDRILGFAIALFIAANVRDATPAARLATMALAPWAAFAATAAAAVLLQAPLAAAAFVPVLMFAVTYGGLRGPRYLSLGIVALIAYFVALVTRQPPETLPMRLVVLLLAAGDAALVRFVLLPERPQDELDRLRHAIRSRIDRMLGRIAAAVAAGTWTQPERRKLHADILRLHEVIQLAQARLVTRDAALPGDGGYWLHLLRLELDTERVARAALQRLGTPTERPALLEALHILRHRDPRPLPQVSGGLGAALTLLGHALREQSPEPMPLPSLAVRATPTAPDLRPALQTAIASGLAILGGELVSPSRWYWAAFAAFAMFQGTRSRIESITKGAQFMLGTLAGVVLGILSATLLSGHELLSMAAIVVAVFLAFQANVIAYGIMIFWITIILGLLFGMLGYFPPEVLLLRLKETAVGAVCGMLVAVLLLVRRERAATNDAMIAFLRNLGRLVTTATEGLRDRKVASETGTDLLAVEQSYQDLAAAVAAERSGSLAERFGPLRRSLLMLEFLRLLGARPWPDQSARGDRS